MKIDHIVISVKNLKLSAKFYSSFLGKPTVSKDDVSLKLGETKLFIPYPLQKKSVSVMQDFTKPLGINVVSNYSDKNLKATRPYLVNAEKLKKTVRYWMVDLIAQKV